MRTKGIPLISVLAIALFLSSCGPSSKKSGLVEITFHDDDGILNYGNFEVIAPNDDGKAVVYMKGPSMLCLECNFVYLYLPEDGDDINLRVEGDLFYVNDIVRAICMDSKEPRNFAEWYASADEKAIKAVRSLDLQDAFSNETAKISAINPFVLSLEDFNDGVVPHGTPLLCAIGSEDDANHQKLLERIDFSEIRVLFIAGKVGPLALETLARKPMPNLFRLIVSEETNQQGLLDALPRLKAVTLGGKNAPPRLDHLRNLEELNFFGENGESPIDLTRLPNPGALRSFSIATTNAVIGLERLTGLEYFNPGEVELADEDLEAIVARHPKLIFLNLMYAMLESLEPLANATSLEALVLGDFDEAEIPDFAPLAKLKNLRYVGLSEKMMKSDAAAGIREACPQIETYTHDKVCLGSGWLILFLPILLIPLLHKRFQSNPNGAR